MITIVDNFLNEIELKNLEETIKNKEYRLLDDTGNHVGEYTKYRWFIIDSALRSSEHRYPLLKKLSDIYGEEAPTENLNTMQLFAKIFDKDSFCDHHKEDPHIYGNWVFMLYLTDEIDGAFCAEGLSVLPKRNRVLITKVGFEHWVEKCSGTRLNITGWSFCTDEVIKRWSG